MKTEYFKLSIFVLFASLLVGARPIEQNNASYEPWDQYSGSNGSLFKIGDQPFPSNPMNDRAMGMLLKGKAKSAIVNYGEFIEWDVHPAGMWGDWTYLPDVCFVTGVPGQSYSYRYDWFTNAIDEACPESENSDIKLWCSSEAYTDDGALPGFSWYEGDNLAQDSTTNIIDFEASESNFVSVVFEEYTTVERQYSILGTQVCNECSVNEFSGINQWKLDHTNQLLIISLEDSDGYPINPNNVNAYGNPSTKKSIGLVYPWAMRPKLLQRTSSFDIYDYGADEEEWTSDDDYMYYGANVAESWFTRWDPSSNTDWQPTTDSKIYTHNSNNTVGDIFGTTPYISSNDTYPLLAHSELEETWPEGITEEGTIEPVWPGGYADSYLPEETGCYPAKRWNDDCWLPTDRFISDQDVYLEFDDRWAHRGNNVIDGEYESLGYPMGLHVMATAHSYSVSFAEDIMFVTVDVRNESGEYWCAFEKDRYGNKIMITDDDGGLVCGDGIVMPDGTFLNGGEGFTYRDIAMGFYMDADVITANQSGSTGSHTNPDDFMEYYDCANPLLEPDGCQVINDDTLRVSIAMIYDYDGVSGAADGDDIGYVGTQLLDSPYATDEVDLDGDGFYDIFVGEKLKMTDWHWFDWFVRPGVTTNEAEGGCCAGDAGKPVSADKEEIHYKIISGDTTNLTDNQKLWYFHTANPAVDADADVNPHFDSLDGLDQTSFFIGGDAEGGGLDCVLEMTCGPFSLEVGEQVPFSFCIIFGRDREDLIENARFAQLMYNSHYQGYTPPDFPTLSAVADVGQVKLSWDDAAENSSDVVTGYSDFEGYKIYRSTDGGQSWGNASDVIYNNNGEATGWQPYAQFHLTPEQDSLHCVYSNNYHGDEIITYEIDGNGDQVEVVTTFDCGDDNNDGLPDIRGYKTDSESTLCGPDPHQNWFSFGDCNDAEEKLTQFSDEMLCDANNKGTWEQSEQFCYYDINNNNSYDEHIGVVNEFIDYDVVNGVEYTYTITAYDTGIAPDYITNFNSDEENSWFGTIDTTYSSANPLHFATPDGYNYLESGFGSNKLDKQFVQIKPGPLSAQFLSNEIMVVPNPYIVNSAYNEEEYKKQLRFTNLPENFKFTIFTISGEKILSFNDQNTGRHIDCSEGSCFWNLRTYNNQEVAPGLYIFAVEDLSNNKGKKFIGKFAIIR